MDNRCLVDTLTALATVLGVALVVAPACGGGISLHVRDGAVEASPVDNPANADAPDAGDSQPSDAVSPADGGGETAGRAPLRHRPAGTSCPSERAPGWVRCGCGDSDGGCSCGFGQCGQDSDCTGGTNGRCLEPGPSVYTYCVYDTCFSDSDCPSNQPCGCRASASDNRANSCLTGSNCRIDTDCGLGGYCSPSQVGNLCGCMSTAFCKPDAGGACYVGGPGGSWTQVPCACGDSCGHGYFCHTPQDTCVDDSDCTGGNACNFDLPSQTWTCSWCMPVP
jgi:hypothetical protein